MPGTLKFIDSTNDPSLLAEYVVSGAAVTSIDFTGLDIITHRSYRIEIDLVNPTSDMILRAFVNNDTTTTNYQSNYGGLGSKADIAGVSADAPKAGKYIVFASLVGGYPIIKCDGNTATVSGLSAVNSLYRKLATVTNITQLTFTSTVSGAIGIGSTIRIYRGDV